MNSNGSILRLALRLAPWLAPLGLLPSCAKDLRPTDAPPADEKASHFTTHANPDGTSTTIVEATSETDWRYFDFESEKEVEPLVPESSAEWDIAFQRFRIKTNGGVSGTGDAGVAFLVSSAFDSVTAAAPGPYVSDREDSEADPDTTPDFAFNVPHGASELGWYLYDPMEHTLSPADIVYVVRTVERRYVKVQMIDYYNDAGTSGYPTFRWSTIDSPSAAGTIMVDVSGSGYVYLSVANRGPVSVADPERSTAWDLAVDEAAWETNSGGTRAGIGGARLAPAGTVYDTVSESPTAGFVTDRVIPFPGPPGAGTFLGNPVLSEWFDYDSAGHTATPKGLVHLIRTATGDYGKMQIVSYDNERRIYAIKLEPIPGRAIVDRSSVDASNVGTWTYFNLRLGAPLPIDDPGSNEEWDIGLSGARLRTNSGTSGPGRGGAVEVGGTAFATIASAPASGYEPDRMLPDPLEAGAQYSGNPILAEWYEYAVSTSTAPRDTSFVVRTANGDFAKLKVTSYAGGVYVIDWAYAGAGRSSF